jgi:hypothetical protein
MARCHRLVVAGVLSGVFLPAFTAGAAEPSARKAERLAVSASLAELARASHTNSAATTEGHGRAEIEVPRSGATAARPTSAMAPTGLMPAPAAVFDGLSNPDNFDVFGGRVTPPDTNGDVGPNHYVQ